MGGGVPVRIRDRVVSARTVAVRANPRFITIALVKKLMEEVKDPRTDEARGRSAAKQARLTRKRLDFMVDTLINLAMDGDLTAIKMVMDRVEGLAIQTVQYKMSDVEDGQETPQQMLDIEAARSRISVMPKNELRALYHSTISGEATVETAGAEGPR